MGLTGAGKSTLLPTLLEAGHSLLPERRDLTDRVILPAAQRMDGLPLTPVADRLERFRLTARYREEHPEGIVHALTRELTTRSSSGPAVFDGLRGEGEVRAASARFPEARFLMLIARPSTRVRRLMSRADRFDQVSTEPGEARQSDLRQRIESIEGAERIFAAGELIRLWQDQPEREEDLLRAVRIVVTEQNHYGEEAACSCLERLPSKRRLIVDSEVLGPAQIAERVRSWLAASSRQQQRDGEERREHR